MDADVFISLSHFKGHESTGFGGALKNIGMGCGSRAGKMEMHSAGKPHVDQNLCVGCQMLRKIVTIRHAQNLKIKKQPLTTINVLAAEDVLVSVQKMQFYLLLTSQMKS